jgi:hypothetical protein
MLDTELIRRARDLYVQTRNMTRVHRELKRLDYVVSMSTLKRWKREGDWDGYAEKLDARLNAFNEVVLDFEKEILEDLIVLARDLKKKIKDSDKKDSQLIYSYLGVVKQIQDLKKIEQVDEEAIVDEVMRIFMADPIIGPVLQSRKTHVMKLLKKWKNKK